MGDTRRGIVMAEYIKRHFPRINKIISVADGNLILSNELCHNYTVSVYDPKIRNRNKFINIHKGLFLANNSELCDLVVGIHPDGATGEIVDYSIKNRINGIIVPCCIIGKYANECNNNWAQLLANKLKRFFNVEIDLLPISGKNLAIRYWRKSL